MHMYAFLFEQTNNSDYHGMQLIYYDIYLEKLILLLTIFT